MGRAADACQFTPHEDSGSYCDDDPKVQTMGRCTAALRRPQRGIRIQSSTSSEGPRTG
jgi:hypothetical protein